jgi:hypothetical protein
MCVRNCGATASARTFDPSNGTKGGRRRPPTAECPSCPCPFGKAYRVQLEESYSVRIPWNGSAHYSACSRSEKVPTFDLQPCRGAGALDPVRSGAAQSCMDDEQGARRELQKRWLSFPAADRRTCSAEIQAGGQPSYVELLVCLQDAPIARQIEAKSKL